ncbi:VanZ family protein [Polynucleobacter sphagniphilus]|uniref:VanZ family protein n=1 Tax=Polynucleobacter sphagniphilus TaxID=1743169 RepID=UPI0024737315|nr:VanZ family protein [Polynucleobacter sphagniphilus]
MKARKFTLQKPKWLENRYLLIACVFYVAMFFLGTIRALEHSLIWSFNDKLLHFLAYFFLMTLIFIGLQSRPIGEFFLPRALACLAIISVAGALDEIAQYFVGRDSSFDDWLADAAAAVVFLLLMALKEFLLWAWAQYQAQEDGESESHR